MRLDTLKQRLTDAWRATTREQRAAGRTWYAAARAEARSLARSYHRTVRACAGVLAALSPRVHWSSNVRLAREVCAGCDSPSGAMRDPLTKALAIRDGARPLSVLRGDKVRAFYRAILGDRIAFVLDVWMLRALRLAREATAVATKLYARVAEAALVVARRARVAVSTLQAALWVRERGRAA